MGWLMDLRYGYVVFGPVEPRPQSRPQPRPQQGGHPLGDAESALLLLGVVQVREGRLRLRDTQELAQGTPALATVIINITR